METTTTAPASDFPLATAAAPAAAAKSRHMPTMHVPKMHMPKRDGLFRYLLNAVLALFILAHVILSIMVLVFDMSNTNYKINTNIQTVLNFFVYPTVIVLSILWVGMQVQTIAH